MEVANILCRAHILLRSTRQLYHGFLQQYISANSTEQEADAQNKMNQCKEVIAELTTLINSYVPPTPMPAPVEAWQMKKIISFAGQPNQELNEEKIELSEM